MCQLPHNIRTENHSTKTMKKSVEANPRLSSRNSSISSDSSATNYEHINDSIDCGTTNHNDQNDRTIRGKGTNVIENGLVTPQQSISPPVQPQPPPSPSPPIPPDGGANAWMQVAGSFMLFFNCWGTVNAFGVFQTYYEDNPYWSASPSDISWIGSIQAFLLLMVGVVSGPLYDAGYFRALVISGGFLVPFGFMMTSLCRTYWQTMLAQGIIVGIGNGCLFVPSVAILPHYFAKKKSLVSGIAASGSSMGGVIYPIMFRRLQQDIGFPWATRVLAFVALAGLSFSCVVMKPRTLPLQKRSLFQFSAFKETPYLLFSISTFFSLMAFYGPLYYLQTYAIEKGITTVRLGFYLLPICNSASIPGRIIPNFLADHLGPLNVMIPLAMISGLLTLSWIAIDNLPGIIIFALLYGFFSGGIVSLPAPAVAHLTSDMRVLGTRMGQMFFVSAFGLLIGSPIAGLIYSKTGDFLGLQLFSGLMLILTGGLIIAARVAAVGWKFSVKT